MSNVPKRNSIFKVRLRLHYTWIFALILIIIIVSTQYPESYSMYRRLLLGVATGLIFLVMMILRQTAINFLALRRGIPLRKVTLYLFGGVPGIAHDFSTPLIEILLGTAGLLSSVGVIFLFFAVYVVMVVTGNTIFGSLMSWLAFYMIIFAIFHVIPGFPLDGGRILRGILWMTSKDYDRANRITSQIGRGAGLLCIAGGLAIMIINLLWLAGGTLILMGWVLLTAASQNNRLADLQKSLRKTDIRDIVTNCPAIAPQMSLKELETAHILNRGECYLSITENDKLVGSITLAQIKSVPVKLRETRTVGEVMFPVDKLDLAYTGKSAADVLEQMDELEIDLMPVMEGDKIIGIISREALINLGRIRRELRYK